MHPAPNKCRGIAFVLVLWIVALLGVMLGSFALLARTESLQARHLFDTTTARYAAEAGLNRAVVELYNPDPLTRWVADGRPYEWEFEGVKITIEVLDDSGKIDLNAADALLLQSLFKSIGQEENEARKLAEAILDWRDPDDLVQPYGAEDSEYESADYPYGSRDAPFETIAEVQQVLGMDYAMFRAIEPFITIYSGSSVPNAGVAPFEVLRVLPGMNEQLAQSIVDQRRLMVPGLTGGPPLLMPDGSPIVAQGGGLAYSVKSRATLPNGAFALLDATIRLGGATVSARPFVVLRWRDGESS